MEKKIRDGVGALAFGCGQTAILSCDLLLVGPVSDGDWQRGSGAECHC